MKFVTTQRGLAPAQRGIAEEPRRAVTEVEFAFGEARCMTEQSGHHVTLSGGVLEAFAEHHVAAALTVHRPRLPKSLQLVSEFSRGGESSRMKLRVAAGQPAAVGMFRRCFVGEGRKRNNLGARLPPGCEKMRVNKAERPVVRQRDPLARRRQRRRI